MRMLFHIPIVHAPEDLGSHLPEVKREYIARHGVSKWNDHNKALDKFWHELSKALLSLPVDYTKVRLYQDGLPVFGRDLELVEKLAENGNRNYQLLHELAGKGATVMGTEDPELLIEERNRLIKCGASSHIPRGNAGVDAASSYDDLMERRDQYIAQRIASTLKDGEIGLLLIGALHRVVDKLPKDIQVLSIEHGAFL